MARYFFHILGDGPDTRDNQGVELASLNHVRREAMRVLPEIARDEVPRDGDHQSFTVLVTDERDHPVYTATLTFAGIWLNQPE
jgi:hypothetical protein